VIDGKREHTGSRNSRQVVTAREHCVIVSFAKPPMDSAEQYTNSYSKFLLDIVHFSDSTYLLGEWYSPEM
jgi:hypothetical protein